MKNVVMLLTGICMTFMVATNVSAAEKKRIRLAVLDFTPNNTTKEYALSVRNKMEVALFQTKAFKLVERREINSILREHGLQMTGVTDTSSALEVGRLLAAEYIAVGSVDRTSGYTVTLKIIKVERGSVKFAHAENAQTDNDIQDAVNSIAELAAKSIAGVTVELPKKRKKNDDSSLADKKKKSGKSILAFRESKKEHLITEFAIGLPMGTMKDLVHMGYGGAIAFQYRDGIVLGIEGTVIKFRSKASQKGYYLTMPVCATVGFNLIIGELFSLVPYVSGGGAWNWSKNLGRYPYINYPKKGQKNELNGFVKPGLLCEIHPGSLLKITLGAYYGMIFNDKKHTVKKGYTAIHAGLGFRY